MTPQGIFQVARRWLWLLVLGPVVAASASFAVSLQLPRVYESTAKLLVTAGQSGSASTDSSVALGAERLTPTYVEIIKTRSIVEEAVQTTGLDQTYEDALKLLDISPLINTQLIQITARADTPETAARLANAVASIAVGRTQERQAGRFAASTEALKQQVVQLTDQITASTAELDARRAEASTPLRDTEVARLQFELAQLQQSRAAAVKAYEDVRVSEARSSDLLVTVDRAAPTSTVVAPRTVLNVVVAAIVGLLGAIAVVQLLERNDDRLSSEDRLTRFTGLHVLSTIPWVSRMGQTGSNARSPVLSLLAGDNPSARPLESFRVLRANLRVTPLDRPLRTLLVTSADAGDGKSATAAGLAIVSAQAGQDVILVDANFYRPSLHNWFGVEQQPGLLSLLVGEDLSPASVLVPTHVEGLRLLPGAPFPVRPSDLLGSRLLRDRIMQLRDMSDLVIIDSPPVLEVSDSILFAEAIDATLLVVHAQQTRGHRAARGVSALRAAGARVVGAVLNGVGTPAGSRGYAAPARESGPLATVN